MNTETFFATLFEDREYTPAHFPDAFWSSDPPEMPWLERLDRRINITRSDLVLQMEHRRDQWPAILALEAAGFGFDISSYHGGYWLAHGRKPHLEDAPWWSAAIRQGQRFRAPDYYSAEVSFRTHGPCNHRAEWSAIGDTPAEALERALLRAREGVALLIAAGAP